MAETDERTLLSETKDNENELNDSFDGTSSFSSLPLEKQINQDVLPPLQPRSKDLSLESSRLNFVYPPNIFSSQKLDSFFNMNQTALTDNVKSSPSFDGENTDEMSSDRINFLLPTTVNNFGYRLSPPNTTSLADSSMRTRIANVADATDQNSIDGWTLNQPSLFSQPYPKTQFSSNLSFFPFENQRMKSKEDLEAILGNETKNSLSGEFASENEDEEIEDEVSFSPPSSFPSYEDVSRTLSEIEKERKRKEIAKKKQNYSLRRVTYDSIPKNGKSSIGNFEMDEEQILRKDQENNDKINEFKEKEEKAEKVEEENKGKDENNEEKEVTSKKHENDVEIEVETEEESPPSASSFLSDNESSLSSSDADRKTARKSDSEGDELVPHFVTDFIHSEGEKSKKSANSSHQSRTAVAPSIIALREQQKRITDGTLKSILASPTSAESNSTVKSPILSDNILINDEVMQSKSQPNSHLNVISNVNSAQKKEKDINLRLHVFPNFSDGNELSESDHSVSSKQSSPHSASFGEKEQKSSSGENIEETLAQSSKNTNSNQSLLKNENDIFDMDGTQYRKENESENSLKEIVKSNSDNEEKGNEEEFYSIDAIPITLPPLTKQENPISSLTLLLSQSSFLSNASKLSEDNSPPNPIDPYLQTSSNIPSFNSPNLQTQANQTPSPNKEKEDDPHYSPWYITPRVDGRNVPKSSPSTDDLSYILLRSKQREMALQNASVPNDSLFNNFSNPSSSSNSAFNSFLSPSINYGSPSVSQSQSLYHITSSPKAGSSFLNTTSSSVSISASTSPFAMSSGSSQTPHPFQNRRPMTMVKKTVQRKSIQQMFEDYETLYQEFEPISVLIDTMFSTYSKQVEMEEKQREGSQGMNMLLSEYGTIIDTRRNSVSPSSEQIFSESFAKCIKSAASLSSFFANNIMDKFNQVTSTIRSALLPLSKRNKTHFRRFQLYKSAKTSLSRLLTQINSLSRKTDLAKLSEIERSRETIQLNLRRLIELEFLEIAKTKKRFEIVLLHISVSQIDSLKILSNDLSTLQKDFPSEEVSTEWMNLRDSLQKEYEDEYEIITSRKKDDSSVGDIKSFILTEKSYIDALFHLVKVFGFSMLNDSSLFTDLNRSDIDAIYSSLPTIIELHSDCLAPFFYERKESLLYFTPQMLNVIICEYSKYFHNFTNSINRLDSCLNKSSHLRQIVEELERLAPHRGSLHSQLALPLERVKDILAFLENITPSDESTQPSSEGDSSQDQYTHQYQSILQCTEIFRQLSFNTEFAAHNTNYSLLESISWCMEGSLALAFYPNDRKVIAAGPIFMLTMPDLANFSLSGDVDTTSSKSDDSKMIEPSTFAGKIDIETNARLNEEQTQKRSYFDFLKHGNSKKKILYHYFLFSDILVIAKRLADPPNSTNSTNSSTNHASYLFYARFPLKEIQIKYFDSPAQKTNLEILSKTGVSFGMFATDNEMQKRTFIGSFQKARDEINTSKVFHTSLTDLLSSMRESGRDYPSIIDNTLGVIVSGEVQISSLLFRKTISVMSEVKLICKQIDSWTEVKYNRHSGTVLSAVFLRWLRCLPTPIVPPEHFDNAIAATFYSNHEKRISAIRKVVHSFPSVNRITLQKIIIYLYKIAENNSRFRLTVTELAITVGPLLMRARNYCKNDFDVASLTPIYYFTEMLIRANKQIFSSETSDSTEIISNNNDSMNSFSSNNFDNNFLMINADDLGIDKFPPPSHYLRHLQYTVGEQPYILSCTFPISECDFDEYDDNDYDHEHGLSLALKDVVTQGEVEMKIPSMVPFKVMVWKNRWLVLKKGYVYIFHSQKDQVPSEIISLNCMYASEKQTEKYRYGFVLKKGIQQIVDESEMKSPTSASSATSSSLISRFAGTSLTKSSLSVSQSVNNVKGEKEPPQRLTFKTKTRQEMLNWIEAINKCRV